MGVAFAHFCLHYRFTPVYFLAWSCVCSVYELALQLFMQEAFMSWCWVWLSSVSQQGFKKKKLGLV